MCFFDVLICPDHEGIEVRSISSPSNASLSRVARFWRAFLTQCQKMAAEVPPSALASQQNNSLKRKSKERNWTEEEIEALIGLYEERVCLWDVGNGDYMNRDSKELAYSEIDLDEEMKKHDIDREEYKYKWKILRSQFMREREAERKKKSGQGAKEVYSSKWKWFSNLKYLTTIDANVSTTQGYDTMKKVTTIEIGEDNDETPAVKTPKKMKAAVEKQRLFILDKTVQVLNSPTETSEPKQLNEDEHFGMFVAKSLACLSGRKKVLTQKKISDILFESELQGDQESGQFIDLTYNHFRSGDHYFPGYQQTYP